MENKSNKNIDVNFIIISCVSTHVSLNSSNNPSTYSVTTRPYDGSNTCLRIASTTRDGKYGGPHCGKNRGTTNRTARNCSDTYSPARVHFPPPAPDPQSDQLDSILSFLAQQMSNMESRLTATFGPQLQAESQQIADLTHQLGNGQSKHPQQSPQRKRSKTNVKSPASSPSFRPDGASDQEDTMDETAE
jgi:hypothetical protein